LAGGPVARLAEAVTWLEEELARIREKASGEAGQIMRTADLLMGELENDAAILVEGIVRELHKLAEEEVKRTNAWLDAEKARLARELEESARANRQTAVEAVLEKIVEALKG
jgi:hypothetical protein